ncbi:hypothetical protein Y1Q_0000016 [Alligator mississippiensis]|uniref:Uncharacterized protein n=1 Tax=Alligator mississippiensis TaxID=8496 RepID=A0A151NTI7_ALLMI|nr:hypothetical protein Y1Q_0000016 [Alligator mississippiensis]
MIWIHGASYTYEHWRIQLMVLDCVEEIAVGLAKTLPCPMLLGVDWPHLQEVVTWVLAKRGDEEEKDRGAVCFRAPEEEERGSQDVEQITGDGYFREEQKQEPLFQNVWQSQLAKNEGEVLDP